MKGKRCCVIILAMLVILSTAACSKKSITNDVAEVYSDQELYFSKADYFYSEDTEVEILSNKPCDIYYTTDGSEPSKAQTLYTEAIKLKANSDTKANSIKAKAYYKDGTESKTILHTYFVGKDVNTRFDTLVFSVTTDPFNLYDYEYGIFVEGKLRDDFIAANPDVEVKPSDPANYNIRGRGGEREVYLEVFEPDGTNIVSQAAGIRTYGGWSRAREQKSIRIFARKEYDEENSKLCYEFFPNRTSADGQILNTFKQLVLRNCGNDNGFTFVRDELFQTLAAQAGYQDYEAVRPATMFVNGEYRGFFWIHETYCDSYFEEHYGDYNGSVEILEGGETYKILEEDASNANIVKDYEDVYAYSNKDLTNDTNYDELCNLIDVENYLSYYAFNIYLGNEDWPHNNYKTYRYYATEGEDYGTEPFDGKWRYLLHDMDFSTNIYESYNYENNIELYIGANGEIMDTCPLFGQLMQREDCREIFIKKTLDLLNGAFAYENFTSVLDEMGASRLNELKKMYGTGLLEDWVSYDILDYMLQILRNFADSRTDNILTKYQEHFKLGDIFSLYVQPAQGCQIKINSYVTDTEFIGRYYSDYDTTITAILPKGKKIDYWLVNGEKVEGDELIVTSEMITDGEVEVSQVLK